MCGLLFRMSRTKPYTCFALKYPMQNTKKTLKIHLDHTLVFSVLFGWFPERHTHSVKKGDKIHTFQPALYLQKWNTMALCARRSIESVYFVPPSGKCSYFEQLSFRNARHMNISTPCVLHCCFVSLIKIENMSTKFGKGQTKKYKNKLANIFYPVCQLHLDTTDLC